MILFSGETKTERSSLSLPKDSHKKTALACMLTPSRLRLLFSSIFLFFFFFFSFFLKFGVPVSRSHGPWLWSLDILVTNLYCFFSPQEDYFPEGKGNLNAAIITKIDTVMAKPYPL